MESWYSTKIKDFIHESCLMHNISISSEDEIAFVTSFIQNVIQEFWRRAIKNSDDSTLNDQEERVIKKALAVYMTYKTSNKSNDFEKVSYGTGLLAHCTLLKNITLLLGLNEDFIDMNDVGDDIDMNDNHEIIATKAAVEQLTKVNDDNFPNSNETESNTINNPTNDKVAKENATSILAINKSNDLKLFVNSSPMTSSNNTCCDIDSLSQKITNTPIKCECGMRFFNSKSLSNHRRDCKVTKKNEEILQLKKQRLNEHFRSDLVTYQSFCNKIKSDLWQNEENNIDDLSAISDDSSKSIQSSMSFKSTCLTSKSESESESESKRKTLKSSTKSNLPSHLKSKSGDVKSYYSINQDNILHIKRRVKKRNFPDDCDYYNIANSSNIE